MPEQVQQHEALHLEIDIRIEDDPQPVDDPSPRRLEITILDRKALFHNPRRGLKP